MFPGLKEVPQEFGKLVNLQSVQLEVRFVSPSPGFDD